jgi:hypothetical protein
MLYLKLPLIKPSIQFVSLRSSFTPEYGFPTCLRRNGYAQAGHLLPEAFTV